MVSVNNLTKYAKESRGNIRWLGLGLLVLYLLLYVLPLGNRQLAIPDETRYAEIPREMLVSGDWVTPRLDDLRYFEKTPLGYWLNAASISVFGENPFAVRLPSTLAAGLTILLVFLFALKVFSSRRTAILAAFIQMTFLEVYIFGTFNVLDNLLTLLLTTGIMSYYLAAKEPDNKLAWGYYSAAGLSLGLAFLTKGFLAVVIPFIVLAPWLIWHRHWRALLVKGWVVLLIAVLVALPWVIFIQLRESDFWHYFFWIEHIKRFMGVNAQHKAPFYYFLVVFPLLAFPWLSLLPAAISGLRTSTQKSETLRFLWLWLLLPLVFFSISHGKLVTYVLPCFPPLAILIAIGLEDYLRTKNNRLFSFGLIFNSLVLLLLLGLLISQIFNTGFSVYQQNERPQLIMSIVALLTGLTGGWWALKSRLSGVRLMMNLLILIPFVVLIQFAMPNQLKESKMPGKLFTEVRNKISPDTLVVTDGRILRAVNWYLKRDDVYLLSPNEMTYGLSYSDAAGRLLNPEAFAALLANRQHQSVAVFCIAGCPKAIKASFPVTSQRYSYGKFSMWLIKPPKV